MTPLTVTLDSLNLNDGSTYLLWVGADMGAPVLTFDEQGSYTGAVTQTNVSTAHLIPAVLPIRVKGTSLADLDTKVQAINTKIVLCTAAAPKNLVYGSTTYQIVASPCVSYSSDEAVAVGFWTILELQLNRLP